MYRSIDYVNNFVVNQIAELPNIDLSNKEEDNVLKLNDPDFVNKLEEYIVTTERHVLKIIDYYNTKVSEYFFKYLCSFVNPFIETNNNNIALFLTTFFIHIFMFLLLENLLN